jgi:replicative DNA helicase
VTALARNGHTLRPAPTRVEVPTANESARVILGAVLVHPKSYNAWREHVAAREFFTSEHRLIAEAIEVCHNDGCTDRAFIIAAARVLLSNGTGPTHLFDQPGAIDRLLDDLAAEAITFEPEYLAKHARHVRAAYQRRRRAQRLSELAAATFEEDDAVEHLERIARFVEDERKAAPSGDTNAAALVKAEWSRPLPEPIQTGLAPLDKAIGGLRAEGVYFLAGGTGQGKSGLAIQISGHIAATTPVVYVTSELSRRQVIARFAAQRYNHPWLQLYQMPPQAAGELAGAVERWFPQLYVVRLSRETSVVAEVMRVMDRVGVPPVLVLDYIQHAARRLNPDDRRLATSALSDDIARYTTDTRGTALVLSSVARGFYKDNADKSATDFLGAAKESGDLEFDASGVMFLDTELEREDGTRLARLHVAKSRFGGEGATIGLKFDGRVGRFSEDPEGALTDEQRDVFETIKSGAQTLEEVSKAIHVQKSRTAELIHVLASRRLISRRPLRVL